MIDLHILIKNGVHFGHQTSRWSPKMEPYIWGYKNNIHLIDVSKTAFELERASKFLESVASEGKTILWVGTKKAASAIIEKTAGELHQPFVAHRWVGGTFSNYRQVRKAISNLLHYEDILAKSEQFNYNKKELNTLKKRLGRLDNIVGGIRNLSWPIGAVVVVDVKKEHVCIKEAVGMGIPVVGIVDTNSDPSGVDYVIPANDDAPRSIAVLIDYMAAAVSRGQAIAAAKPKEELAVAETFETLYEGVGLDSEEEEEAKKKSAAARRPKRAPAGGARPKAPVRTEPAKPSPAKAAPAQAAPEKAAAEAPEIAAEAPTESVSE